ncbi:glycine N-acyltransferase-like protein 2 [Lissotriton helveticus]
MLILQGTEQLHMLERNLVHSFPESLKVYGSVFHINRGNPFNLEVLVDSWPEFKTVIVCPQPYDMKDDYDHYNNTYFIYTSDPLTLKELLEKSNAIDWSKILQIQGLQASIGEIISSISARKSFTSEITRTVLYVKDMGIADACGTAPTNASALETDPLFATVVKATQQSGGTSSFPVSQLNMSHAQLVNENWAFGGNERSLSYIRRCIEHFPSICALGPNGQPVSWSLMEQSCEIRMGFTVPEFRRAGLSKQLLITLTDLLQRRNVPFYLHVAEENTRAKGVPLSVGLSESCFWYQWKCSPIKRSK